MSRRIRIGAVAGLILAVIIVGLWPNGKPTTATAPESLNSAAVTVPEAVHPAPTNSPHTADIGNSQEPPTIDLSDFQVFGEAVKFMPGELCDGQGNCSYEPVALHDYAEYTDEELRTLSAFDGSAAIVLAHRLGESDWQQARQYAARGFVLTGDPYAYHMTRQFSGVSTGATYDRAGNLDLRAAQRAYVWIKIGYELGASDGASLAYQAAVLSESGYDDFKRLDALADATRREVEQVRLKLVGEGFK
ncbi:MAG: hypothetical protein AAGI27_05315 [Pseudomonadota bacterium]